MCWSLAILLLVLRADLIHDHVKQKICSPFFVTSPSLHPYSLPHVIEVPLKNLKHYKFEKNHRIVAGVQWNPEFRQSSVPPSALGMLEVAAGSSVLVPSHVDDACFFQGKNRAHKRRRKYLGNPPPFPQCYMELGCKHSCFCLFVCLFSVCCSVSVDGYTTTAD